MDKKLQIFVIYFIPVLLLCACKKYEDGPRFSLRSKKSRAEGTWKLERKFLNGSEQLLTEDDRDDRWDIKKNNDFTFSDPGKPTISGNWDFDGNKDNLIFTHTVDVLNGNGNVIGTEVREIHEILRLKDNELWLKQSIDGNEIESHYVPA